MKKREREGEGDVIVAEGEEGKEGNGTREDGEDTSRGALSGGA